MSENPENAVPENRDAEILEASLTELDATLEPAIPEKYKARLLEMEKMLKQVEAQQKEYLHGQNLPSDKIEDSHDSSIAFKSAGEKKAQTLEDFDKVIEETAASYSRASYWISIVTTGVSLMVLPGILGFYVDQQLRIQFWGPTGIMTGMVIGLIYLIRTGNENKRKNKG